MSKREDALGVLSSTRFVVERSKHVQIDMNGVSAVAARIAGVSGVGPEGGPNGGPQPTPTWNLRYHFSDRTPATANYVLVLDTLNFSFWGEPRWRVEFLGECLNGYWALAAALKRALAQHVPILDADYLANLSPDELAGILRGEGDIPMLNERLRVLRESGRVLRDKYDGQFVNAIAAADREAVKLVQLLAREFPSFNDVATYEGRTVYFYKRAQILVGDLHGAFLGQDWGHFPDIDRLTAFADYKVPQVLRRLNMLQYSPELLATIRRKQLIPSGDPREVEIRAGTIWAVEELRRALLQLGVRRHAFELDWYLWELGQQPSNDDEPYHLTRTIFY